MALIVSDPATLVRVDVAPSGQTIPLTGMQQFKARGRYCGSTTQDVTATSAWASSNTDSVVVGNVPNSPGLATALDVGDTTITASIGGVTGSTHLTVVSSISISPHTAVITPHQAQMFLSNVSAVTWSVDGIASGNGVVGTISSGGVYSPPPTPGTHTITASSIADPSQQDNATLVITDYQGVLSYHNDNARTGQNLSEVALTPLNVNQSQFGKIFSMPVDGQIYAQPLYVENLSIPGHGTRNVVFVATEGDSVYAFDADGMSMMPLWKKTFVSSTCPDPNNCVSTVPSGDVGSSDLTPQIGITGTPVISLATAALYVVAKTKETINGNISYVQRLHALDIASGNEKFGGPITISASVPGEGAGAVSETVSFNALRHLQRSGLLLSSGIVYISFASHGDNDPYHGWVLGYDSQTLQQVGVYNDTPNGAEGGIWQSGGAPASDDLGHIFLATGNGTFDADGGGTDVSDCVLRLDVNGGLQLADWFAPFNQASLALFDLDLGSGGVVLLPDQPSLNHPHLLVLAGKEGTIYLLNRDNLGHFHSGSDNQIVQELVRVIGNGGQQGNFSTPAFWNGNLYFQAASGPLKSFALANALISIAPTSVSLNASGFPGSTPSVTANGNTNAIVWTLQTDAFNISGPAVLHAFDATNVAHELYNSNQAGSRDFPGAAVKFTVPTIANGKVFVGSGDRLTVFGLFP
jgi:hypothetical protein